MPLTGELEHLPIVDVIQLIHSTKKSGTLNVYSHNGEGQLAFNNGYIISASHSNKKLRVGSILLEKNIISQTCLDKALGIQELSGDDRKPLITTLINNCGLSKESAYQALEDLIGMTIVEMICWSKGVFTLDVDEINISDDYRYLPDQLQSISLDTQMVLMDALRIFDEKVYAGEIQISNEPLQNNPLEELQNNAKDKTEVEPDLETEEDIDATGFEVSEDLLGLADLDKVERRKPYVFKGLEVFDPASIHRQVVNSTIADIADASKDDLVSFLSGISSTRQLEDKSSLYNPARSQAVILFTSDEFLQHAIMTVCKNEGILVFVTADKDKISTLVDRALNKFLEPILVFGEPSSTVEGFSKKQIIEIRSSKMAKYPQISIIQLASTLDYQFLMKSLNDGCRAVFPLPYFSSKEDTFAANMVDFLNTFQVYIRSCFNEERRLEFSKLRNSLSGLRLLVNPADISLLVLKFVSEIFERTLTLIVDQSTHKQKLIAERSIGIISDKNNGPEAPMKVRIPIHDDSAFREIIDSGTSFLGKTTDSTFTDLIYPDIGPPKDSTILLLPLKSNEKVITITYADFGDKPAKQISQDFLNFFACQAGIVMENALFRKRLAKSKQK